MKQPYTTRSHAAALIAVLAAFGSIPGIADAQPVPPAAAAQPVPPPPPAAGAHAPPPNGSVPAPPPPRALARRPAARRMGSPPLGGVIVAARPYHVQIRTRDGRYVNLDLRNGTVINPLGTTLTPGMRVAVRGVPRADNVIATNEIDVRVGPPPAIADPRPAGPREAAAPPPKPVAAPPPPPPQR